MGRSFHLRGVPAAIALVAILLSAGCVAGRATVPGAAPVAAAAAASPTSLPAEAGIPTARGLRLIWASTEYFVAGPADPVVELRLIVEDLGGSATQSSTIVWDPSFNRAFTFLRSEPAPWRVRTDDRGWGTLDTAGVIPGQFNTFRVWFVANAYEVIEPSILYVANGNTVVAQTTAQASHLKHQAAPSSQDTFERGPVAAAAQSARFLPARGQAVLPLVAAASFLLVFAAATGGAVAFRACR